MNRSPVADAAALLIALERQEYEVFTYLLGEEYINVWDISHLRLVINALLTQGHHHMIGIVLDSLVAKNVFLGLSEGAKAEFVNSIHRQFDFDPNTHQSTRLSLSNKPYAPFLLVLLIERDNFRKLYDYTAYVNCINQVSNAELQEMSGVTRNEELFMNFLRYV
jgi:hypothetical protein